MSESLEKLRQVGAQKIHEQTHIALRFVQAILHESFDDMQKIQLMGFLRILEREYHVDLEDVRQKALEYFKEQEAQTEQQEEPYYKKELLGEDDQRKKLIPLLALVVAVAIGFYLYFVLQQSPQSDTNDTLTPLKIDTNISQTIETVKENNDTLEENLSLKEEPKQKEAVIEKSFRIIPKTKVWVGYIDLSNNRKRQTITKNVLELNASKDYLLTFGHGYIDIEVNGKLFEFKKPKQIKFLYQNGELKEIDAKEFKRYNKGRMW